MASDRVNEVYEGKIFKRKTQEACRRRIHWMCAQVRGDRILDIGCSQGIASLLLGRDGHQVVGVDIDPAAIAYAQKQLESESEQARKNVRFELSDGGSLPFEDGAFDTVLLGETLEHLTRPERVLLEVKRLLRPGGRVVITVPFGVHPHPDHLHTFYLSNFLETLSPHFAAVECDVSDKYIRYVGESQPAETWQPPTPERLLDLSERAFLDAEQGYWSTHDSLVSRLQRQEAAVAASRQGNEKAAEASLRETLALLQSQVDSAPLSESLRRIAAAVEDFERDKSIERPLRIMPKIVGGVLGVVDERVQEAVSQHLRDQSREVQRLRAEQVELAERLQREREQLVATLRRHHAEEVKKIKNLHKESREKRDKREKALEQELAKLRMSHEEQRSKLQKTHGAELARLNRALVEARREAQRAAHHASLLESRLNRQGDQLEYARASLELREQEVRYKLGDALVSAYYHPTHLMALPGRMVNLFTEGLRRRRERHHAERTENASLDAAQARRSALSAPLARTNGKVLAPPQPSMASPEPLTPTAALPEAPSDRDADPTGNGSLNAKPAPRRDPSGPAQAAAAPAPAAGHPEISFTAAPRALRPPRLPLKAAVVMDDFTYECFRDECNLIRVHPNDWQRVIEAERADFLFVESTWKGNNGAWSYLVNRPEYKADDPLPSLVRWCRERSLPTVFWNKEDPPNYDRFIAAAELFDWIFTTDADCVPRYRERVGHDRVFALPFAAQPAIHNPINSTAKRLGHLCFAGTYYQEKYPQRQKDIETLLGPAASRGLTIFDRQHGYTKSKLYRFPDRYQPFIRGGLSYMEMVQAYKAYEIFLNINSVRESPTMFSRRVLELLACGTAVITTPSLGVERLLGRDAVGIADTEQEAVEWMDRLIADRDLRERMVLRGQRRVFTEHTYEARLREIIDRLGLLFPAARRRVSVVTVTNRPAYLDRVIDNYRRQAYPHKELILVLNNDSFRLGEVTERLAAIPDARVFQRPESCTLGECLNFAVDQSQFEFVAKMDDDDFYAEHYLTDMVHAFLYCDTEIVGKRSYYAYLEHKGQLALRFPESEHQHVKLVSGATLVVRRELFEHQRFPESVPRGVDTLFQRTCADRGFGIYAVDRFNFVATRSASSGHTWQISDEEFMEKCRVIAETDDYRPFVVA